MKRTLGTVVAIMLAAAPVRAQQPVAYDISFPNAVHHEAQVTVVYHGLPAAPLELRMSRASPGRYALHEFAKNVYSVAAVDGAGRELHLTRPDPYGWNAEGHDGTVKVTYTLFGDHADGTYAGIDRTHAHLSMPATFMWAHGTEHRPITVTFHAPAGSNWKVATQLEPTSDPFAFRAPDLQYFMDSPTELSDFDLREWPIASGGHQYTMRMALHDLGTAAEFDDYVAMTKKVVAEQEGVFGEFPEYDFGTYTFIADYLPWVYGDGMEHRNSTSITSTRPLADGALRNLYALSHEYFHSWNMERIRSKAIEPFDFERANMSGELWFGEGFTNYYDDLFIRRAGIIDVARYVSDLAGPLNAVIHGNGRKFHSPVGMSRLAPFVDAATSIDATNFENTFISYYTWGSMVALGLDLTLRSQFDNVTLDDYMRTMWRTHGKPFIPYTLDDLRTTLGTVTKDTAFANDFFRRYVTGRDVPDFKSLLASAGVLLRPAAPGKASLGRIRLQVEDGKAVVATGTLIGTPIYDAGVDRGDILISLDGKPIEDGRQLATLIAAYHPGDTAQLTFEQRAEQRTATVTFNEDDTLETVLYEQAGMSVTDAMKQFREDWLRSHALP